MILPAVQCSNPPPHSLATLHGAPTRAANQGKVVLGSSSGGAVLAQATVPTARSSIRVVLTTAPTLPLPWVLDPAWPQRQVAIRCDATSPPSSPPMPASRPAVPPRRCQQNRPCTRKAGAIRTAGTARSSRIACTTGPSGDDQVSCFVHFVEVGAELDSSAELVPHAVAVGRTLAVDGADEWYGIVGVLVTVSSNVADRLPIHHSAAKIAVAVSLRTTG